MKHFVSICIVTVVGIVMAFLIASYFIADHKQNTIVQTITETIRTSAIKNVDNSSRVFDKQLFISEEDFEKDFLDSISSKDMDELKNGNYTFEYLKNTNGSYKAIRVRLKDTENHEYQATCVIDVSES